MFLAPPPAIVSVKPSHEHRTILPANQVSVDNGVAATIIGETPTWPYILVWTPKGVVIRPRTHCITQESNIVLAGTRFAHVCNQHGSNTVLQGTFKSPKSVALLKTKQYVTLAGHGSLIAGSVGNTLWRFDPGGKLKLHTYKSPITAYDVDGGRILVGRTTGLQVVSSSGKQLSAANVGHEGGALLRGSQIVRITAKHVVLSNLTGKAVVSRSVVGVNPTLVDMGNGLVVYNAGTRLHLLRLSDGRDVGLRFKNQISTADAKLWQGGLYYGFTSSGVGRPGHAGYISAAGVQALLKH
jgi:hypothetical protein